MTWKRALGVAHGDFACVRIFDIAGRYGIQDDEFFHGLLTDDLCNVMYGSITDMEMDTACRAWLKWHDAGLVFFVSHILSDMIHANIAEPLEVYQDFVEPLDERVMPVSGRVVSYNTHLGHGNSFASLFYDSGGSLLPLHGVYSGLRSKFKDHALHVLTDVGFDKVARIMRLVRGDFSKRYGLSCIQALRIADDLSGNPTHGDWFMSLLTYLGSDDNHGFSARITKDWVRERIDYPVEFITESPLEDHGAHEYHDRSTALFARVMELTDNGYLDNSLRWTMDINGASPSHLRRLAAIIPDVERIPDAVWSIMGRVNTTWSAGFTVSSWLQHYGYGLTKAKSLSLLERLAHAHDDDVWYRWAVFTRVQSRLAFLYDAGEYCDGGDKHRRLLDVPVQVEDYVFNGVMPERLDYEYDGSVAISVQSDDEVRGRVKWIIRMSTGYSMVSTVRDGRHENIFDVLRTIPITLDGFMRRIGDTPQALSDMMEY